MNESAYFQKLDNGGTEWTRECLQAGGGLSHAVLQNADLGRGLTLMAVTRTEHREAVAKVTPFNWAVLTEKVIDPTPSARLLLDKLREIADRCKEHLAVIVEDNLSKPGDLHLENIDSATGRLALYKNKFFNILSLDKIADANELALHLNQSSGYPLNAFAVPTKDIPSGQDLNEVDVDNIASSTLAIMNFAYDGETYTLWLAPSALAGLPEIFRP